jgi:hypothetical protein
MLKYILIPVLVIVVVVSALYLYLHPDEVTDVAGTKNSFIEEIDAIVHKNHARRMQIIRNNFSIIEKIVNGIKKDKIACIIPKKNELAKLRYKRKIILPESAAFGGGDAVLGSESMVRQRNPLLQIVKEKEKAILSNIDAIQLDLDTRGDKYKTRLMKKVLLLKNELDRIKRDVISGCARQKVRLKHSHPHLANYVFVDESVDSVTTPLSTYMHGDAHTPVSRSEAFEKEKPGLVTENHASYY